MKALHLHCDIVLDRDGLTTLAEVIQQAIEKGIAPHREAVVKALGDRPSEPPRPVTALVEKPLSESSNPRAGNLPQSKRMPEESSEHAQFGGRTPPDDVGVLVNTRQAAKMLSLGERTIWRLSRSGIMPKPMKIGNAVRWKYEDLKAWIDAGCPRDERWGWPR